MDISNQLMMPRGTGRQTEYSFNTIYHKIIESTLAMIGTNSPALQSAMNERTGVVCHTYNQAISFSIKLGDTLPTSLLRRFYPATAAAEAAWFLLDTQDATWIKKHCPIWDQFTEDDGKTIEAAYGYRWRSHFGRDQIEDLISGLMINPSDRRTVVCAWDPAQDGLMNHGTKNVPCPFAMTFHIVGHELMVSYFIRSSDLYVGLPYDIMCTAFVIDAIRAELAYRARTMLMAGEVKDNAEILKLSRLANLKNGWFSTTLANPHMYDNHVDLAKAALKTYTENPKMWQHPTYNGLVREIALPNWRVNAIETSPDSYVQLVKANDAEYAIKALTKQRPEVAA